MFEYKQNCSSQEWFVFAYDLTVATAVFVPMSAVPEDDGKWEEFIKEPLKNAEIRKCTSGLDSKNPL